MRSSNRKPTLDIVKRESFFLHRLHRLYMASTRTPAHTVSLALLMAGVVAIADFITGYEVRLAVLYMLPIAVATWRAGIAAGIFIAVIAVVSWSVSFHPDHRYSSELFYFWEGGALGATFVVAVFLLARLRNALGDADRRFREVLQGLAAYVYVTSEKSGNILYANPPLERLLGMGLAGLHGDVVGQRIRMIGDAMKPEIRDGSHAFSYYEARDLPSGRSFGVQAGPVSWESREPAQLHVLTDITEQKEAAVLKFRHREMVGKTSRMAVLAEIATMLGHELNQPLMAITTYNSAGKILLSQDVPDIAAAISSLDKSAAQAARASEIVSRTRSFLQRRAPSMLSAGINALIRDAIQTMEPEMRGILLDVDDSATASLVPMSMDPTLIEQVIVNLLSNAADAARSAGRDMPRIGISTAVDDGDVVVSVQDNGEGIASATAAKLYDAFFTTKPGGLGLGLSICRSIIEAHHGQLEHHDLGGAGTVFSFRLPIVHTQETHQ
jgi:signal transduction histidine kinase